MHVDAVIPTYDRKQLLGQAIVSLEKSTHSVTAIIIIDGNPLMFGIRRPFAKIPIIFREQKERLDWIASINGWLKEDERGNTSAVLYAGDDLEFEPDCIKNAVAAMQERFPDGDGLVAINQQIPGGCESAFGLMGRKFINRFPNGAVFCPDYVHWWSDHELGEYARSIGKFYWCEEARVKHNRPHDQTYRLAHLSLGADHRIRKQRETAGLIWGQSFRLMTAGDA